MAEVTGYTSQRMKQIEDTTVVDGEVQGDNLILLQRNGTPIDAGNVRGPKGDIGNPIADGNKGDVTVSSGGTNWQLNPGAVTNAELANSPANTIKGAVAAGAPVDLTGAQAVQMLPPPSLTSPGVVPALPATNSPSAYGCLQPNGTWGSSVPTFATGTARDNGWINPPNGAICVTLDLNILWQRCGGVWVAGAQPRRDAALYSVAPQLGGNWYAPNDGITEWMGNTFQAPAWANNFICRIDLGCIRPQDNTNLYNLRTKISQSGGADQYGAWTTLQGYGTNYPHSYSWGDRFTLANLNQIRVSVVNQGGPANGLNANQGTYLRYTLLFFP